MGSINIQDTRVKPLNQKSDCPGAYVLYWMQQSQRACCNHTLEFAVQQANERNLPLLVCFGLMDDYPEANARHYRFLLEGLKETEQTLAERGIRLVILRKHPVQAALELSKDAALVVCDRGYLRHQKIWRSEMARKASCHVVQIESDVVVPVNETSDKAEFAARTIRPKIHRQLKRYLVPLGTHPVKRPSLDLSVASFELTDLDNAFARLKLDRSVAPVSNFFKGGTHEARQKLHRFLSDDFRFYAEMRNQPQTDYVSHLAMHLHFGQISPLEIALAAQSCTGNDESKKSFLEELIVRRELAQNYTEFNPAYDQYDSLPRWARATLEDHRSDEREHLYSRAELDGAKTHDPYWNAAMLEMKHTGYMHNAMRMYWGKKILEWSRSPEEAFQITLELNNRYFLDGRDPNSYANVAWVYGLHDRPWQERPIFGKVRYMNAAGLERKCDIQGYVRKVNDLVKKAKPPGANQ